MARIIFLLSALLLFPCVTQSQPQAQPPAPPAADLSQMPPDCLVAGEFTNPDQVCGIVERLMGSIEQKPEPGMLRRVFGKMMGNPGMDGVALDRPMRFYYMSPKLHGQPWVYQVAVADAAALTKALGPARPAPQGHPLGALEFSIEKPADENAQPPAAAPALPPIAVSAYLLIQGDTATIYFSPSACDSLLRWEKAQPPPEWRVPGQLRARFAIQHLLSAYDAEFTQEVQAMRDRMREALERLGKRPETEEGIRSAQGQLDMAVTLVKQVENLDIGIDLSETAAAIRAYALPLPRSTLANLVRTHPRASLELFKSCPAGVDVVFAQNISMVGAVSGMLLSRLGLPGMGEAVSANVATQTLVGLLLPQGPNGTLSGLMMRTNQTAESAGQFWSRLAQAGESTAFGLKPVEPPGGETVSLAEVTVNEAKLGPGGTRALRRVLGPRPMAAQELRSGRSVLAIGAEPLALLAQVRGLDADPAGSLGANMTFLRTKAALSILPNVLLYASPEAVARWLALAEIPAPAPRPGALGFAAECTLMPDGCIQAGLLLPLGQILQARTQNAP